MGNRVIHFEIQADDLKRAKAFYEQAFGWKIEQMQDTGHDNGMEYFIITTGEEGTPGINGGMYLRPKDKKIYTYDCTILVDNSDKAISDVKQNGGTINGEKMEIPKVGWFVGGMDSEGNKFGLMQSTEWQPK